MQLDDELCLCFHVTKRKVVNYLRIEKPRRVGQLSECFGAGTGCGWCRPYLQKLFDAAQASAEKASSAPIDDSTALPTAQEYAQSRAAYVKAGKGTPPPGATPVE